MHLNQFFSAKAILRRVLRCKKIWLPFFSCQSLLLSTIVLNDIYTYIYIYIYIYVCVCVYIYMYISGKALLPVL